MASDTSPISEDEAWLWHLKSNFADLNVTLQLFLTQQVNMPPVNVLPSVSNPVLTYWGIPAPGNIYSYTLHIIYSTTHCGGNHVSSYFKLHIRDIIYLVVLSRHLSAYPFTEVYVPFFILFIILLTCSSPRYSILGTTTEYIVLIHSLRFLVILF